MTEYESILKRDPDVMADSVTSVKIRHGKIKKVKGYKTRR